jgi:5-methylcytosine-specific restriction endonuclease McrA
MDQGSCSFCGSFGDLEESHVLPAFLYRWLRQRGAGHIRNTETPNRRVQDGLKFPWLCRDCEARFSRYETAFAMKLFHPWQKGCEPVEYEDWLLKFCVSVSWRVLKYARG